MFVMRPATADHQEPIAAMIRARSPRSYPGLRSFRLPLAGLCRLGQAGGGMQRVGSALAGDEVGIVGIAVEVRGLD